MLYRAWEAGEDFQRSVPERVFDEEVFLRNTMHYRKDVAFPCLLQDQVRRTKAPVDFGELLLYSSSPARPHPFRP